MTRPLREILFCFGCVRPVLRTRHCGRPTVRMYAIDLTAGGADVTTGRQISAPEPDEFLADPEATDLEEGDCS